MKISILTPSYNSELFVKRAIESVLAQQYNNFEHIIVDNASTDGTAEIVRKYKHVVFVSEKDKGQSDAMNKAFRMATGDIIVYLNADDYFENGAFDTVINAFSLQPDADMVVGRLNRVNGKSQVYDVHQPSIHLQDILDVTALLFPLNPACYFYKKDLQHQVGTFPENNHFTMDYWFLLRAYFKGKISSVPDVLGSFHEHGSNKTSAYYKTKLSQYDVLKEFGNEFKVNVDPALRRLVEKILLNHSEQQTAWQNNLINIKKSTWYRVGRKMNLIR